MCKYHSNVINFWNQLELSVNIRNSKDRDIFTHIMAKSIKCFQQKSQLFHTKSSKILNHLSLLKMSITFKVRMLHTTFFTVFMNEFTSLVVGCKIKTRYKEKIPK